jgi:hypothetical protein
MQKVPSIGERLGDAARLADETLRLRLNSWRHDGHPLKTTSVPVNLPYQQGSIRNENRIKLTTLGHDSSQDPLYVDFTKPYLADSTAKSRVSARSVSKSSRMLSSPKKF